MKLEMQKAQHPSELDLPSCDVAIVGTPVDDRGSAALDMITKTLKPSFARIKYDPDSYSLILDGAVIAPDEFQTRFSIHGGRSILLEATTLGFVEIFLCCRGLLQAGIRDFHIMYVEPVEYTQPPRRDLLRRRDFELSDQVRGYEGIPGAAVMLREGKKQKVIFFLGYEARRVVQAIDEHPIDPGTSSVVFGVPAFRPGWEMHAFTNNLRVVQQISGGLYYCSAESPAAAFNVLRQVHGECRENEQLFVAPIGTKPHGIGVALFASMQKDVGILYDHPVRRAGRSHEVSSWHLYKIHSL